MNEVPLIRGAALELGNYRCWGTLFGGERHNAEGFMGYLAGAELYWQTRLLRVGARWIHAWYQPPITTAERWYQYFYFQGKEMDGSVDYRFYLENQPFWRVGNLTRRRLGCFTERPSHYILCISF